VQNKGGHLARPENFNPNVDFLRLEDSHDLEGPRIDTDDLALTRTKLNPRHSG